MPGDPGAPGSPNAAGAASAPGAPGADGPRDDSLLADRFEAHRPRLRAVAYRMLGSFGEAEDAVQDAWLRLSRSGTRSPEASGVEDLSGRLTVIVARDCLDRLRSRVARREEPWDPWAAGEPGEPHRPEQATDPEQQALLADPLGAALLAVQDTLTPAERLAFVLHDMFAVPFEEIAPLLDRTPAATRQLASRARLRVQGTEEMPEPDLPRQREVVAAFLAASRDGDADALLALLDPDVTLRADAEALQAGVTAAQGARAVAECLAGRARAARLALVDGAAGLAWVPDGEPPVAEERAGPGLPGPDFAGPGLPWPGTTRPGLPAPGTTSPGLTSPGRTEPGRTEPGRAAPGFTGPALAVPDLTVLEFTVLDGRITAIDVLADAGHVGRLDVEILDD
ncbi:sigma-70 family RNA polymerase sigma factor [Streptomyces sp. ISL-36]|nr:sigma-70 family RNA polymerase sigma factor [Streptomyces sp. ISL-36]